jgi:hypothetical protein
MNSKEGRLRPRGRPKKPVKRQRGRPKAPLKKRVGRPPGNLKADPDRFAIVATVILNQRFKFPEREAANIALNFFEPRSQSGETLRWKARKTRAMLTAYRKAEQEHDQRIKWTMWTTVLWYRHISQAILSTIQQIKNREQNQQLEQIRVWAELAEETEYARLILVPLALSGFEIEFPKIDIIE